MMKYGLIGYPLGHSFSKAWFEDMFHNSGLEDFTYSNFPIARIEDVAELLRGDLSGLNVTLPYKQTIIPYLNQLDKAAWHIGAVNTLARTGPYSWKGYNTDAPAFRQTLKNWIPPSQMPARALILGSGGASKAIQYALQSIDVKFAVVSTSGHGQFSYDDLTPEILSQYHLLVQCTPLGMHPDVESMPPIPYTGLTENHWVYDLVYNPANTLFLTRSQQNGAKTKGGLEMLQTQAMLAWEIWKMYGKF